MWDNTFKLQNLKEMGNVGMIGLAETLRETITFRLKKRKVYSRNLNPNRTALIFMNFLNSSCFDFEQDLIFGK